MSLAKDVYLERIRAKSAYPTYRGVIGVITVIGYLIAVFDGIAILAAAAAKIPDFAAAGFFLGAGLLSAVLLFLLARCFREGALILADIGDSIIDANARTTTDSL